MFISPPSIGIYEPDRFFRSVRGTDLLLMPRNACMLEGST